MEKNKPVLTPLTSSGKVDLTDIVFQGKNQEYGAYVLRKLYSKFLTIAVIAASLTFVISISSPIIIAYIREKTKKQEEFYNVKGNEVSLESYKEKKEEQKVEPEQPKEQIIKTTIAFVAPEIKADEDVKEVYQAPKEADAELGKTTQTADNTDINLDALNLPDNADQGGKEVVEEKQEIFKYVEEMPSFPNGQDELMKFFGQNVKYPEIARRAGVEGKVFVQFVVGKDGRVGQVSIAKGIGAGCDEEAIRVVKMMPNWTPGKQNGRPVLVQVIVPIIFKLQ